MNRKDNETECNEGTKVCQAGECKGSICLKFGMDQVTRSVDARKNYPGEGRTFCRYQKSQANWGERIVLCKRKEYMN